nr:structural maintenance of chromosomes protein 3-like [Onthophagus taurus]
MLGKIDANEISLRRIIGIHKDQFILNKKNATRTEVMNYLESAGFTNSNPYYIVKQGTINQMALASDSHRLKLLNEVAGTKLYIEKREECLKIFKNAELRLKRISEDLDTLDKTLSTLEEQKKELKQYQYYNQKRSAIQYSIGKIKLKKYNTELKSFDEEENTSSFEKNEIVRNFKKIQEQIQDLMEKSKNTKNELNMIKEKRNSLSNERENLIKKSIKLDFTVNNLLDEMVDDKQSKKNLENELTQLELTIKEQESELDKVNAQYEAMKRKEEQSVINLTLKIQKQKELIGKEHRRRHFTVKDDRNRWIQNELKLLDNHIKEKKNNIEKFIADLKQDDEKYTLLINKLETHKRDIDGQRVLIEEHNKECYELKRSNDQQQTIKNELWRKKNTLEQYYSSLKGDLLNAEQCLRSLIGKAILKGCDSVRKVLATFRERGESYAEIANSYFGLVIDNFNCDKTIYTPVEVTAKNKLFNHIVESDYVATMILKEIKQQKLPGDVVFAALNRLKSRQYDYPHNKNCLPLVCKLNYDEKYDKVMKLIFGKTLICRTVEDATHFARTVRLDCVTLDGDFITARGTLTGGYINFSRSKLKIQTTRNEIISKISSCENELKNIREDLIKTETTINNQVAEMEKIEIKKSKAKETYDKIKKEITLIKEELSNIDSSRVQKEHSLYQLKAKFEQMQSSKENFELELKEELLSQPSAEHQTILESLKGDIETLEKEHNEAVSERTKLETEKNKFSSFLNNNLITCREQIKRNLEEMLDREVTMQNIKTDEEDNRHRIEKIKQELEVLDNKRTIFNEKLANELEELNQCQMSENNLRTQLNENAEKCRKFESKVNLLKNKIDELTDKMKQLEPLSSKFDNLNKMTINDVKLFAVSV